MAMLASGAKMQAVPGRSTPTAGHMNTSRYVPHVCDALTMPCSDRITADGAHPPHRLSVHRGISSTTSTIPSTRNVRTPARTLLVAVIHRIIRSSQWLAPSPPSSAACHTSAPTSATPRSARVCTSALHCMGRKTHIIWQQPST